MSTCPVKVRRYTRIRHNRLENVRDHIRGRPKRRRWVRTKRG